MGKERFKVLENTELSSFDPKNISGNGKKSVSRLG